MKTVKKGPFEYITAAYPSEQARPDLLFIHGATLSKGLWKAQVEGLKGIANTLALDLPGHGGSQGPGRSAIEDYAADVFRFIGDAGIHQDNLILCGMSMGGAIVQQLLIDHPGRFKAAVLINTGARLKVLPAVFQAARDDYRAFIRSMPAFSLSPQTDATPFEEFIVSLADGCDAETAIGDFEACNRFDVMEKVPGISCPVLVCSAEHDVSTPVKYGLWLKDHLPSATYTLIAGSGHLSMIEKPEVLNDAIRAFLAGLSRP